MRQYGKGPKSLGRYNVAPSEQMAYLYLPISMTGDLNVRLPRNLDQYTKLITDIAHDVGEKRWVDSYVYMTVKRLHVSPGSPGNRPGWHADGFGSNGDLNYIMHSINPTEFCEQKFHNIRQDDKGMLEDINEQAKACNISTYQNNTLLRLDEDVIHRVGPVVETGMRNFLKVSVSKHRYNLADNSHNYAFNYDWDMHQRAADRNMDNKDYKP